MNAGAALYVENRDKLTPCELGKIDEWLREKQNLLITILILAEKNGHKDLAIYLESRMIFSVCWNLMNRI